MPRWAVAFLTGLAGLLCVEPAMAQRGQDGLTLYGQQNFGGERRFFSRDEDNLARTGFNDAALSARVSGYGVWQICVDAGNAGRCVTLDRDEPDLNRLGVGLRVSSVRRVDAGEGPGWGGGDRGRGRGGFGPRPPRGGLSLYEGFGYGGARYDLSGPTLNLGNTGFNDRARSLATDGPWWVCAEMNYNRCQVVDGAVDDLAALGLENRISSARPVEPGENGRHGGGWAPPHGGYDQPEARGLTAAFFARPSGRGGALIACEHAGHSGQCAQRTADDFCRGRGFSRAHYFSLSQSRRGGRVINDLLCVR